MSFTKLLRVNILNIIQYFYLLSELVFFLPPAPFLELFLELAFNLQLFDLDSSEISCPDAGETGVSQYPYSSPPPPFASNREKVCI